MDVCNSTASFEIWQIQIMAWTRFSNASSGETVTIFFSIGGALNLLKQGVNVDPIATHNYVFQTANIWLCLYGYSQSGPKSTIRYVNDESPIQICIRQKTYEVSMALIALTLVSIGF